ncbi:PepSY domain-containing protein [Streptomyces sp. L2]|uniref:PepSY domain-containing protein n=1 Tax=Streptomyces sp. L2 TaxID=2162665 RepID=UPI001012184C|nr:PepSY domain-containing protein [Streptomyces sp. L2]
MAHPPGSRTGRRRRFGFVVAAALLAGTAAACSGPPPTHPSEVLPQVETEYDRAIRKALDEVSGSRLVSVGLSRVNTVAPVWRTSVATEDGTEHLVRVGAAGGDVLGADVPAGQSAASKTRTGTLVAGAKLLPEEAVDRVRMPEYGKVTDVRLEKDATGRTVWSVTIETVGPHRVHAYRVDAVTGEVTGVAPAGSASPAPSPSSTPSPSGTPSATPAPSGSPSRPGAPSGSPSTSPPPGPARSGADGPA